MALVSQPEILPAVSFVSASYNARETIGRCLSAVTTLETAVPFEVVAVDSSHDGTAELVAAGFPKVTLVTSASRLYPGDARSLGVERARADILAFTDTDFIVDARWIEEIAAARPSPVLPAGVGPDTGFDDVGVRIDGVHVQRSRHLSRSGRSARWRP